MQNSNRPLSFSASRVFTSSEAACILGSSSCQKKSQYETCEKKQSTHIMKQQGQRSPYCTDHGQLLLHVLNGFIMPANKNDSLYNNFSPTHSSTHTPSSHTHPPTDNHPPTHPFMRTLHPVTSSTPPPHTSAPLTPTHISTLPPLFPALLDSLHNTTAGLWGSCVGVIHNK